MSTKRNNLLKTLAVGVIWGIFGMLLSRIFGYGIRALIAHHYGVENYGIINTAQSLMIILSFIALVGMNTGLPRQISFFLAKSENEKVRAFIFSALKLCSVFSLIAGFVLFSLAEYLGTKVFNSPQIKPFIVVFAVGIPLYVLYELITSIFKGLKWISYFTLLHDILRFTIILVLIFLISLLNKPFIFVALTYPSTYLILIIFSIYLIIRKTDLFKFFAFNKLNSVDKEILNFSFPLMLSGIFWMILPRTDTILIGSFLDQRMVGLYNAAVPIGQLILIIRQSFSPIILPLFTELFAHQNQKELSVLYLFSAKWTMLLCLPLFLSMLLLPKFYIWLVFGKKFLEASTILQIVIFGYLIHTIIGPSSNLLIISGRTRLALLNSIIAFIVSITLNIILIPELKLMGAAISSLCSYFTYNFLSFIQVYKYLHLQPFRFIHIKIIVAALVPIPILFSAQYLKFDFSAIIIYFFFYFIVLFIFRVFKEEDKILLSNLLKRFTKK
ncbi:MAG: flippase [Promethearchaeota archaeon]